jgi:hypothetical protein
MSSKIPAFLVPRSPLLSARQLGFHWLFQQPSTLAPCKAAASGSLSSFPAWCTHVFPSWLPLTCLLRDLTSDLGEFVLL